jgi:hypothetical protein
LRRTPGFPTKKRTAGQPGANLVPTLIRVSGRPWYSNSSFSHTNLPESLQVHCPFRRPSAACNQGCPSCRRSSLVLPKDLRYLGFRCWTRLRRAQHAPQTSPPRWHDICIVPSKSASTCSSRYTLEYLRRGRGVGRFCSVPAICFDRQHPILSAGQRAGYGSSMALVAAGVTTLEPKPQTLFGDWSDVLRPVEGVVFDQRIASQCLVAITRFSWAMYSCTHSDAKASILLRDT